MRYAFKCAALSGAVCFLVLLGLSVAVANAGDAGAPVAAVEAAGDVAATTPEEARTPAGVFQTLLHSLGQTEWVPAFAALLWLAVRGVRSGVVARVWPAFGRFAKSKLGGYALGFGTAFLLAVLNAVMAGEGVSAELVFSAVSAALVASGINEVAGDLGDKGAGPDGPDLSRVAPR